MRSETGRSSRLGRDRRRFDGDPPPMADNPIEPCLDCMIARGRAPVVATIGVPTPRHPPRSAQGSRPTSISGRVFRSVATSAISVFRAPTEPEPNSSVTTHENLAPIYPPSTEDVDRGVLGTERECGPEARGHLRKSRLSQLPGRVQLVGRRMFGVLPSPFATPRIYVETVNGRPIDGLLGHLSVIFTRCQLGSEFLHELL